VSLAASIHTCVTSVPIGAPYIGERSWGVPQDSSLSSSVWRAWSRSWSRSSARSGLALRRRNPSEVLEGEGRPTRGRRVHRRRMAAARRRRRAARSLVNWDPNPPATWTDGRSLR